MKLNCQVPALTTGLQISDCTAESTASTGDMCIYSCMAGYTLIGIDTVTCGSDGMFSSAVPTCNMNCQVPALTTGLQISDCTAESTASTGDMCIYSCMAGYTINGVDTVTCGSDGMFSLSVPTCNVNCQVPALTTGLQISGCTAESTASTGDMCIYSCTAGYTISGVDSVTCRSDGMFSSAVPTCNLNCPVPALTTGLVVSSCTAESTVIPGNMCIYDCMEGYTLNGVDSVTCGSDGMFSSNIPTCNIVTCTVPSLTPNLNISGCIAGDSADYRTVCQYSCATGYNLTGEVNTTCRANGTFSSFAPSCEIAVPTTMTPPSSFDVVALSSITLEGEFSNDLRNRASAAFRAFSAGVCARVTSAYGSFVTSNILRILVRFRPGSIVADTYVAVPASNSVEAENIQSNAQNITSTDIGDITVNNQTYATSTVTSTVTVEDRTSGTTTLATTTQEVGGLTDGTITGIALGVFGFVFIIFIAGACCMFMRNVSYYHTAKMSQMPYPRSAGNVQMKDFLHERPYAVGRSRDRSNPRYLGRDRAIPHRIDDNFRTPYVVDRGAETGHTGRKNAIYY